MARTKSPIVKKPTKPRRAEDVNGTSKPVEVLTLPETADYLRVPAEEVLRMVAAEGLPGRKFGAEWRFLKTALWSWLSKPSGNKGLLGQLGKIQDDPYLQEMLRDIYARRDQPEIAE